MRRVISLISYGLDKICRTASIGFLSLMLLLVLFQVLARYVFQSVPVWTEEAARYCMIWGGLFGATVAFRFGKDPRLIQPPKTGSKVWIISATWLRTFAAIVFLGPVLYHSDRFLARGLHRISDGLEIPLAYITVAVPLTVVIIFIHLIARLIGSDIDRPADLN
jgi:TRAP-type C4-dicarboxylate transport system permease small subunit